ncbi:MAG TPA: gamma-glutamyl-gamma-aminobutyrate hydrolase family protein [Chloroflexia bacterium]|nr:gamma-glutamyl-gamma-aminobutyrate hydrolase family protein [Chloroflexia bacterium]
MTGRPIIGITTMSDHDAAGLHAPRFSNNQSYSKAVMAAGGIPLLIPQVEDAESLRALYDCLDGLLIPGGVDINPRFFQEDAHVDTDTPDNGLDFVETTMLPWALADDLPIFGICRGQQVLNVVMGGTLWQDIPSEYATVFDHRESYKRKIRDYLAHDVRIEAGTRLRTLAGAERVWVNTSHHQAVKAVAPGLRATAWSPDELCEGLEGPDHYFLLAVQWHPEEMVRKHEWARRLFSALVDAARARKASRLETEASIRALTGIAA